MINSKNIVNNILGRPLTKDIIKDKISDNKQTKLTKYKKCDFCGAEAKFDAKTNRGPWAYMCDKCFQQNGVGLGTGYGQRIKYT